MFIENKYDRFIISRWAYLVGKPILSDIEYDHLEADIAREYPDSPYILRSWSFDECPVELLKKYNLQTLIINTVMGYMAESISSINTEMNYELTFSSLCKRSRLSYKIDGWNTRVSYYNGNIVKIETRGRSGNNLSINNVSRLFPHKIKLLGRVAITGELSIPNSKWEAFRNMTGNVDQRASVRTAIANNCIEFLSFLAFNIFSEEPLEIKDSYQLLTSLGFQTPVFTWIRNKSELDRELMILSKASKYYDYLTDGLVIENEDYQLAIRLGAWEEQVMASYVTGYEENQGMYGTFLKVLCYPISIEGKTFSKISINNIAMIVENNLEVGSPIAFNLRSQANVVIDSTVTRELQNKWKGRYDEYMTYIKNK